jgi:plastocyanin
LAKGLSAIVLVLVAVGAIVLSARGPGPREIRLVARDMTFYVEGQPEPNPTLRLRAGESVRVVLRNDDAGMTHDFAVPGLKASTRRIESGEEASVTFRAPGRAASEPYTCRPHSKIMRGTILIE